MTAFATSPTIDTTKITGDAISGDEITGVTPAPGALVGAVSRDLVALTTAMGLDWFLRRLFRESPNVFLHNRTRDASGAPMVHLNAATLQPSPEATAHERMHFLRHAAPARDRILADARTLAGLLETRGIDGPGSEFMLRIGVIRHDNGRLHARVHFNLGTLNFAPNPMKPDAAGARLHAALDSLDRIRRLGLPSDFSDLLAVARYRFPEPDAAVARWGLRGAARDLVQRNPQITARSAHEAWMIREAWIALMAGRPAPEIDARIDDGWRPPAPEATVARFHATVAPN